MLYKYRSPDRISDLRDLTIRITQPSAFNDPFEMDPALTTVASREELDALLPEDDKELMRQGFEQMEGPEAEFFEAAGLSFDDLWPLIQRQIPDAKEAIAQVAETLAGEMREQWRTQFGHDVGVISLSEEPDVLLMWSHYAEDHTGFVIEFDPSHRFFWQPRSEKDELRHLRQVTYSENRPEGSMLELGADGLLLTKSAHWSYEKEWRILFAVDEADYVLREEAEHPIYLLDLPPDAVTGLILGCRASQTLREEVQRLTSPGEALEHVEVREAQQDSDEFRLQIAPLEGDTTDGPS